jgi:hypothetical protein
MDEDLRVSALHQERLKDLNILNIYEKQLSSYDGNT